MSSGFSKCENIVSIIHRDVFVVFLVRNGHVESELLTARHTHISYHNKNIFASIIKKNKFLIKSQNTISKLLLYCLNRF